MPVSDFRINSRVRSCLARHWIDTQQVSFGSFRGTVRVSGTLCFLGDRGVGTRFQGDLSSLEEEIRRIDGVRTVHFDFANCWKNAGGEWELRESSSSAALPEEDDGDEDGPGTVLVMEVHERRQETGKSDRQDLESLQNRNGRNPQRHTT